MFTASRTYSNAYKIAEAGGRHSGFLRNYVGRSAVENRKSMNTFQNGKRGINVHLDKIQNPSKYVLDWQALRPDHQQSLLSGWQTKIINGRQKISTLYLIRKLNMENYIEDILGQLIEEANALKQSAVNEFEVGELHGYYRSISILLNQAESFGISDKLPSNFRDFNPEELISKIEKC